MKINPFASKSLNSETPEENQNKRTPTMSQHYLNRDDTQPVIIKSNTRLIFNYQSATRVCWDLFISSISVYLCISIPLFLSFYPEEFNSKVTLSVHMFISLLFIVDILVNFRTSYLSATSEEVRSSSQIIRHYGLSLRFFLDIIAFFPYELFSPGTLSLARLVKIHKLQKCSNLVSLMKTRSTVKLILELLIILLFLLLFIHFTACVFFLMVDSEGSWIPPETYPSKSLAFYELSRQRQYWISVYHSVDFIAGIQNGGESANQLVFFICFYVVGAVLMAILLGNMTFLVRNLRNEDKIFTETYNNLIKMMKKLRLPASIRYKITEFFTSNYNSLKFNQDYSKFISILPPSLVRQVNMTYLASVISTNPIIASDRKILKFANFRLKSLLVQPGVRVISQFDEPSFLFFIASGSCNVEVMDEENATSLVNVLKDGDHFGELSMLFKTECTATVTSSNYTSLAYLSEDHFSELLDVFPKVTEKLMTRIISYDDRWRVFCRDMLRKVPYINLADSALQVKILYSLKQERYESGEIIIHEDDKIDFIYLVAEGEVEFFTYIYDRSAGMIINESFSLKADWEEEDAKVMISLAFIPMGSVLFTNLALTRGHSMTYLRAVTGTHLFKLPIDLLETFARDRPGLNEGMELYKSTLFKYDNIRAQLLPLKFPVDVFRCEKYSSSNKTASNVKGTLWNASLKLKNAVLKVVDLKRRSKIANPGSIKRIVKKIKAMNFAENIQRTDLVRLIANDEVSHDVVKVLGLLDDQELSNDLLRQFALKANETSVVCEFLAGRLKSCRKKVRKLKSDYEEVETLASIVEKLIMESIRLTNS